MAGSPGLDVRWPLAVAEAGIVARGRQPGYRPLSAGSWAGRWLPASR
jgi:hypothetical protein